MLNERIIKSQGIQLVNYDNLVRITESKVSTYDSLAVNLKDQNKLQSERFSNKEKVTKKKLRKRAVIIIGQTVIVILLLIWN